MTQKKKKLKEAAPTCRVNACFWSNCTSVQ